MLVKLFASAFFGTDLDQLLRAAGCDTVVVAGASTSGACARRRSTLSSTATACSCRARPWPTGPSTRTTRSLLDIDAKYGDVISIDEAIAAVEAARRPVSSSSS